MSWEVINTKKIKCLCGKGTIVQETVGDDWNRIESKTPNIMCEECSKKYTIKSKTVTPKLYHEHTTYYCVDKETNEEIELDL